MASVPFNNLITFSRGSNATLTGSNGLIQYAPNNLVLNSEQFDNAVWTKLNSTATANTAVSPDGTTTADTVTSTVNNAASNVNATSTKTSGITYSFSIFVKRGTVKRVIVGQQYGAFSFSDSIFDLETLTWVLSGGGGTVLSYTDYGNGWIRLTSTVTATDTD